MPDGLKASGIHSNAANVTQSATPPFDEFDAMLEDETLWPAIELLEDANLDAHSEFKAPHILAEAAGQEASRAQRHVDQLWWDIQYLLLQLRLKLQEVNVAKYSASELEKHADKTLVHYLSLLSIDPAKVTKQVHTARANREQATAAQPANYGSTPSTSPCAGCASPATRPASPPAARPMSPPARCTFPPARCMSPPENHISSLTVSPASCTLSLTTSLAASCTSLSTAPLTTTSTKLPAVPCPSPQCLPSTGILGIQVNRQGVGAWVSFYRRGGTSWHYGSIPVTRVV